ncbi:TPR-like protein [Podospora aff. communis PSN243]|uniref:TPR-like protein n=1 Tax=Podospora aff. communis PSN243 TaxID=3040156 RepID=A0AAV9G2T8_9PEZI|nr:TPR-like protein [Podospora aff. communis PSN243]
MPPNPRFVGREAELDTLRQLLFDDEKVRTAALVGLGGMGKTQVALQLAYWVKKSKPGYSVFWIPALSEATFEQACGDIVKKLAISLSSGDKDPKCLLRDYLNSPGAGNWFLVVDNADDHDLLFKGTGKSEGLIDYLSESEGGRTLFTTRSRIVAGDAANSDVVELKRMSPQDATSQLEKSLIRKEAVHNSPDQVQELLNELECLPLAITQAAAYLNKNQISVADYLGLLRGTPRDMVSLMSREFRDKTRYKGTQNAVATTWLVSFEQIRKFESAAADLLAFISRIQPKGIPRSLLPPCESEEETTNAIGTLCAYSFLSSRGDNEVFDMHSLVHMATRIWVEQRGLTEEEAEKAIRHVYEVFPNDDHENRFLWREYMPHALKMLQDPEAENIEERYDLYHWVGRCLKQDGRIKEAVQALEQCHRWRSREYPEEHPDRLASKHALASAYESNGQVKEAIDLLEHVVEVRKRVLAEDHPSRLSSQHELASAYQSNGQVKEAIDLLEHVVEVEGRVLDEDHPSRLSSQHALASAYESNGQVKEAIDLLEHVVEVRKRVLAEDHPSRLSSQHELASAYQSNGQVKEAIDLLEHHVVEVEGRVVAEDHPSRLSSQHELASAYQSNGQVKEAVDLLEHVVEVEGRVVAEDHPHRLASQNNLAVACREDGQVERAIQLLEHVVEVRERTLAENHPNRLGSQHALAVTYMKDGQVERAIKLLEKVVEIEAQMYDEDDSRREVSRYWLEKAYALVREEADEEASLGEVGSEVEGWWSGNNGEGETTN